MTTVLCGVNYFTVENDNSVVTLQQAHKEFQKNGFSNRFRALRKKAVTLEASVLEAFDAS